MLHQVIESLKARIALRPRYDNFIGGKWVAPVAGGGSLWPPCARNRSPVQAMDDPGHANQDHRTHVVPLSDLALEILDRAFALALAQEPKRRKLSAGKWDGFAFPSPRGDGSMTRHSFTRAIKRMTKALNSPDATPHDFRRTGSTNITSERIGIPRFLVSRLLNQISDAGGAPAVTGVYDRNEYLPEKRRALGAWSAQPPSARKAAAAASVIGTADLMTSTAPFGLHAITGQSMARRRRQVLQ